MGVRHPLKAAVLSVVLTGMTHAAEIRVPADQPTIQAGIDAASAGDVVLVAPGVYSGAGNKNLDLHGKSIWVRSEEGAAATAIDCEGAGRAFFLAGLGSEVGVEGFTMRNGNGMADPAGGGAIFIGGGAPTIRLCHFERNSALGASFSGGGGAIVLYNSSGALIADCVFIENLASGRGATGGHYRFINRW